MVLFGPKVFTIIFSMNDWQGTEAYKQKTRISGSKATYRWEYGHYLLATRINKSKESVGLLKVFCYIVLPKKWWARLAKFCCSSPLTANFVSLNCPTSRKQLANMLKLTSWEYSVRLACYVAMEIKDIQEPPWKQSQTLAGCLPRRYAPKRRTEAWQSKT